MRSTFLIDEIHLEIQITKSVNVFLDFNAFLKLNTFLRRAKPEFVFSHLSCDKRYSYQNYSDSGLMAKLPCLDVRPHTSSVFCQINSVNLIHNIISKFTAFIWAKNY
jgi:hypothetical protein